MAAIPTAKDLTSYYSSGQVCVCVRFGGRVCNSIVWVGTYNDWSSDVKTLARFKPVTGFDGWYVVAFTDNHSEVNGKAVQLQAGGTFDWKYQTGDVDSWIIHSGTATPKPNAYAGESDLTGIGKSTPLIVTSTNWKHNVCAYEHGYSGTLPVLFINTKGSAPIESKETYVDATYYLDNLGLEGYQSIGSKEQPDSLQIKGRGNWTWKDFAKKPYRLKLRNKQSMMGLKKNKHWTILAHADDQFGWLKNTVGFYLSEQIGLKWTPKQAALEVVLNGDYLGLYMLTEQVRVEKDRVNIAEQDDNSTRFDSITGGWLAEIDNYPEVYHISLTEPKNKWHNSQQIDISAKTPEVLSGQQTNYLYSQMQAINNALYSSSENTLVNLIDIDEAAKYYLVQELMSDCESYHGSCYLHKDKDKNEIENEKWYFGPVWDFGNSFRDANKFIYDEPYFSQAWIGQLASKDTFNVARARYWKHWKYYDYEEIEAMVDSFALVVKDAAEADAIRWPQYDHSEIMSQYKTFLDMFHRHVQWLTTQWGEGKKDEPSQLRMQSAECRMQNEKVMINGQIYIVHNEQIMDLLGRKK